MFRKVTLILLPLLMLLTLWGPSYLAAQTTPTYSSSSRLQVVTFDPLTVERTPPAEALIAQLNQASQGAVRLSYHRETGQVRFLGAHPDTPIAQPRILAAGATAEGAARAFLDTYGSLFGLKDQAQELTVMRDKERDGSRSFIRFQQTHQGVPIVGGELIVQTGANHHIISVNGEILPDLALDITPAISAERARQIALAKVGRDHGLSVGELRASEPELWIYNPILLGGPGPRFSALVWRTEVTSLELAPINEFVLVDAQLGAIALHFNQINTARNRLTYDAESGAALPGVLRRSEGEGPYGDVDVDSAHDYAGDTYDFYFTEHGRDSIDDAGMTLTSTVHFDDGTCPNAFWTGALSQMVYCDGFPQADDVVAHELTHGVTNNESNLFYFYQSGAINESLSDVWGEFVDQTNSAGDDSAGVRWQIGEDEPNGGVIRDMKDPTLFGNPDRMTSAHYWCWQSQQGLPPDWSNGGVHINSGVNNKAAYLMTDGDTFNSYTVTGLGYAKVADLYYEVQTNLLTSAADYADLYDALIQASINLGFSASEQQEVQDAVNAVEMDQQPTGCPATEAPICPAEQSPTNLFFDNLEAGGDNWGVGYNVGAIGWFMDNSYATSGVYHLTGLDVPAVSDHYVYMNTDVTLPANAYLHFNHSFGFSSSMPTVTVSYDGGVLEYSTDGGGLWNDAISLFDYNGYNGVISSDYDNPLAGRQAFSADSRGYISSRLDLSSLAGQDVRFRFRIGTDSLTFDYGWFIDDVRVYTCSAVQIPEAPTLSSPADNTITSTTELTLTWQTSPSPDVIGYLLDFNGIISDVGDTTFYATGVLADGVYTWTVAAYNVTYTGPYTDVWSFTVDTVPPDAPVLSGPANGTITSTTELTLTWQPSPSPDVAGYLLNFDGELFDVGDTTSISSAFDTGTYTWTVAAYDMVHNTSPYTDVWSFTVEATTPSQFAVYLPLVINNYDPAQLLQNRSFDTGDWAPWETDGLPELDDQVYRSASYSARLAGRDNVDSDYVYQEVTVPSNATETTLDLWYRVSGNDSSSTPDYMCIEILDSGFTTVLVDLKCSELYLEPQDQWINFQHVISGTEITPLAGQNILVSFQGWTNATNPSTIWVDDVSFRATKGSP